MRAYPVSKRFTAWAILFVILALLAACGKSTPEPTKEAPKEPEPVVMAATDTPVPPTNTPVPTDTPTPVPTDTPTPVPTDTPTATPDLTATAAAAATQAVEEAMALIEPELEVYALMPQDGHVGWVGTEEVPFIVNTYQGWGAEFIEEDLKFQNFLFQTEVTWESTGGLAACGFIFRADDDIEKGEQYQFTMFRLSGLPAWFVVRFNYGMGESVLNQRLQTNAAINQGQGATNKIAVLARDNAFTFYANGKRLGTVFDSKYTEGNIAYLIRQESGETKCTFANSWVWVIDK